jgi:FkbM family methyltransferase
MTVVVDLGCHPHPEHRGASQDSIMALIGRFAPSALYGFDPHPDHVEQRRYVGRTAVVTKRRAAWIYDGVVAYDPSPDRPLSAHVGDGPTSVPCFDLAAWLRGRSVVVKMDVEGAEYRILEHLIENGADGNVERLLVEWHPDRQPAGTLDRPMLEGAFTCPVEEWV